MENKQQLSRSATSSTTKSTISTATTLTTGLSPISTASTSSTSSSTPSTASNMPLFPQTFGIYHDTKDSYLICAPRTMIPTLRMPQNGVLGGRTKPEPLYLVSFDDEGEGGGADITLHSGPAVYHPALSTVECVGHEETPYIRLGANTSYGCTPIEPVFCAPVPTSSSNTTTINNTYQFSIYLTSTKQRKHFEWRAMAGKTGWVLVKLGERGGKGGEKGRERGEEIVVTFERVRMAREKRGRVSFVSGTRENNGREWEVAAVMSLLVVVGREG